MSNIMYARAFIALLCAAFLVAPAALAATYVVPTDAELIQQSDDIVIATAFASTVERNAQGGIVTRYTLRIDDVLKGERGQGSLLVLTELGGVLGRQASMIAGTPVYAPGARYLVFTSTDQNLEPTTWGMALGQFHLVADRGTTLAIRSEVHGFDGRNYSVHQELARDAERFAAFIRGIVAQHETVPDYFVADARERQIATEWKIATNFTKNSYLMQQEGSGFRWQTPSEDFKRVNLAGHAGPSDGTASVGVAFGEWNSAGAGISYSDIGVDDAALGGVNAPDGTSAIAFGNIGGQSTGAAGRGGITSASSPATQIDGEFFFLANEADVVINTVANVPLLAQQNCLNSVMTHEVGHTLGFRHSDQKPTDGTPCSVGPDADCTSDAIMNSSSACGLNGVLRPYDTTAANTVYGSGPVCGGPTISQQPLSKTVGLGSNSTLTVTASGTGPFTFAWFIGTSGDTSTPTGTGTSTLVLDTSTVGVTNYWVRVSHACDGTTVNSNTATVTVSCTNPGITTSPLSSTINEGQSKQLAVVATGSMLSFQWFIGNSGDTSQPVSNSNSATINVTPATTTSYWVRVSGACGSPVDSATATVTVVPCAAITVGAPSSTQLAGVGNFSITVTATSTSNPITYNWFRGGTPGFGGVSLGPGQTKTVNVTSQTLFWARVTNACGRVDFSTGLSLAPCALPAITAQPQDQTINSGQTANLSIAFTGTGATVKWYRGTVGDKTSQVGTTSNITVGPLSATTLYWAEVSIANCGAVSSRQVTVTVNQLAELVPMLGNRFFVQVAYKNQFDNGAQGKLLGRSLSSTALSDTSIFTFGDPLVVELMVRVSDARPFDNHIHIFLGGLSDVEFNVVITDSLTGIVKEYNKPANQLIGTIDRSTFPASNSLRDGVDALMAQTAARSITPSAEVSTILMLNDRFEVRMRYRNQFTNPAGEGYMNVRSIASSTTTETAVFFFDENVGSVEWMVRFSDARPFAERIDLFHGGLSDVEFTVEVLDTKTGQRKEYPKPAFSLLGQVDRESYVP